MKQGHYDEVIQDYREIHTASWPESEILGLSQVLDRLRVLYLSGDTQTHILHLASTGEIRPHIDNVWSSGTWILAVSLGGMRILRMEALDSPHAFDVPLASGSVYLQR